MYNCPICQKTLKHKRSLDRHVAQFHQDAAPPPEPAERDADSPITPPAPETPPELAHSAPVTPERLDFKAPEPETEYYCIDCGHKGLKRGQDACPGCGAGLAWTEVK